MPTKYCPNCGVPNRYAGSAPTKCSSCGGGFSFSGIAKKPAPPVRVKPKTKIVMDTDDEDDDDDYDDERRGRLDRQDIVATYGKWNVNEELGYTQKVGRVSLRDRIGNQPRNADARKASRAEVERQQKNYWPEDKNHEISAD